ncbi:hypothetical protein BGX27_002087, partial [Mortierella sp. AM989]
SVLLALVGALQDEHENVRYSAAKALGEQLTLPESALLALICALQDEDKYVRWSAAKALGKQSTLPESALLALVGAFKDEDQYVRWSAAKALRKQSTLPESALLALVGALKDESLYVRKSTYEPYEVYEVYEALREQLILPESVLLALISTLQVGNEYVWHSDLVANILGKQSILPESVLLALIDVYDNDNKIQKNVEAVLERHIKSLFMIIPSLTPTAIESLHRGFLTGYSSQSSASLCVQDNRVFFYTAQGPGEINGLCADDATKVVKAFGATLPENTQYHKTNRMFHNVSYALKYLHNKLLGRYDNRHSNGI